MPVLHLSLPVRDLEEARQFYVGTLGCEAGRRREAHLDVWFYGMQITLHLRPEEDAAGPEGSVRHFGVTLGRHEFDELTARLDGAGVHWVAPVSTDDEGLATEQTKGKVADPSGNVIELKTYVDLVSALEISPHSYPGAAEHGN